MIEYFYRKESNRSERRTIMLSENNIFNHNVQDIRRESIAKLSRFGIKGSEIYLIDLIPLIEMIWADGKVQDMEVELINNYLPQHVAAINLMAGDDNFISLKKAKMFVLRYLQNRPDPELLKALRSLVYPVRYSAVSNPLNDALRKSILNLCLDIAAAAVTAYPYNANDRFNLAEKKCYFEILDSLCKPDN
jgi:hypothetical protein